MTENLTPTLLYVNVPVPDGLMHSVLAAGTYGDVKIQKSTLREIMQRNVPHGWNMDVVDADELGAALKALCGKRVVVWPAKIALMEVARFKLLLEKLAHAQYPVRVIVGESHVFAGDAALAGQEEVALRLEDEHHLIALESMADLQRLFAVNIHSRYFNDVVAKGEVIVKKSSNTAKIEAEYVFLSTVPEELQSWFVPVRDHVQGEGWGSYTMPKLPMLDASVRYINGNLKGLALEKFLRDVGGYLKVAETLRKPALPETYGFIADKCQSRLKELQAWAHYGDVDTFIATHTEFGGLEDVFAGLMSLLAKEKVALVGAGRVFSHGDLCLSNMLYDETAGLLQLIDPRGGVARESLRSPYYDLAKLSHSLLGGYDHIINGVAQVGFDEHMQARLMLGIDGMDDVRDAFERMVEGTGRSMRLVRLVEASLFLSMLPLHTENVRKVHLLALRGVEILREVRAMGMRRAVAA